MIGRTNCGGSGESSDYNLQLKVPATKTFARSGEQLTFNATDSNITFLCDISVNITIPTTASLSKYRTSLAATSSDEYALFGGGHGDDIYDNLVYYNCVDAYNKELIRSNPQSLTKARDEFAACTAGNYSIFAGGKGEDGRYATVDIYNKELIHSIGTDLSFARYNLEATALGDYAIFGGGYYIDTGCVDAYNSELVMSALQPFPAQMFDHAATTVGDYALFGGGRTRNSNNDIVTTKAVYVYNRELILCASDIELLKYSDYGMAATTVGNYALFSHGTYVEAYNNELIKTILPDKLVYCGRSLTATTVDNHALFCGGDSSYGGANAYNQELVHSRLTNLSVQRNYLASATIGHFALFAGGHSSSRYYSTVDSYKMISI